MSSVGGRDFKKKELTRLRVERHRKLHANQNNLKNTHCIEKSQQEVNARPMELDFNYIDKEKEVIMDTESTSEAEDRPISMNNSTDSNSSNSMVQNLMLNSNEQMVQQSLREDDDDIDNVTCYEQQAFDDITVLAEVSDDNESNINDNDDFVDELRQWALTSGIAQTKLDALLKMLKKKFLPELPACSKTFLHTASAKYTIEHCPGKSEDSEIVYFGIEDHLKRTINKKLHPEKIIYMIFNIDGSSPYKSSNKQFWPILGKIHLQDDVYNAFPIALYCGVGKPSNLEFYFKRFVEEINILLKKGIIIDDEILIMKIKAFVCDRPGRSVVKNIKNHGAFKACERCLVVGERIEQRTVYISVDEEERTDTSFRQQLDPEHHHGLTPLTSIDPPIDMIKTFLLDIMHLGWLGITKKFLMNIWIQGDIAGAKLSQTQRNQFSSDLLQLKHQIPDEFQRSTASLADVKKWKATQFRFFALYSAPVILKKCLNEQYYKHFMLFHVAMRILSSKKTAITCNSQAKELLRLFVLLSEKLYGKKNQVLNVHSLIHVADDVKNMNCTLSAISAFPFESLLHKIQSLLRSGHLPVQQICRRLHELHFVDQKPVSLPLKLEILKQLKPDSFNKIFIKKIKYHGAILSTKKPNNAVLLTNNNILEIDKMYMMENDKQIYISGHMMCIGKPILMYPCNTSDFSMWKVTRTKNQRQNIKLENVLNKMIILDLSTDLKESIYAMPLLHT